MASLDLAKRAAAAVALATLVIPLTASPARATNGAIPIASGARAAGRGGADTAVADDGTAVNTNPAGLAFIDGQRFDQVFAGFMPRFKWKNPVDTATSTSPAPGFIVGAAFGLAFDLDEPWHLGEALTFGEETFSETPPRTSPAYEGSGLKFGIGVFPVSGSVVDYDAKSPFFASSPMDWEADIKEVAVAVAVAWRPVHWLSIGIAPQFVYAQLENDQPVTQPSAILQGHPTGTTGATYADVADFVNPSGVIEGFADIDEARSFGGRFVLGVMAIPHQWESGMLTLGLSYTSQAWKQDFLGTATVDFTEQLRQLDEQGALLAPAIEQETGIPIAEQTYRGKSNLRLNPLNLPQQVSFGVAVRQFAGDVGLLFALDVRWINWSATWSSFDGRLTDGESVELNELTGDEQTTVHLDIPLEWKDQVVIAGGIAVSPVDWLTIRAGYNYGNNPVPAKTAQPTTAAILEHHATLGLGFHIRRLEVSLSYEHGFENTIRIKENIANKDVENSEITVSLDAVALGLSLRF